MASLKNDRKIVEEYEKFLFGGSASFSFLNNTEASKNEYMGRAFYYVCHDILKWNGRESLLYLNQDIIIKFRLGELYNTLYSLKSATTTMNIKQMLSYAFPDEIKYDIKNDAYDEFCKVMHLEEWENSRENFKYRKNFFTGKDAVEHANCILQFSRDMFLPELDKLELYEFFSNRSRVGRWLSKMKLGPAISKVYYNPLDYLHFSLPWTDENLVYYINETIKQKILEEEMENKTNENEL